MAKSERIRLEAEDRVRKLISRIPMDSIDDFMEILEQNLQNNGSRKTVNDLIKECKNHSHR